MKTKLICAALAAILILALALPPLASAQSGDIAYRIDPSQLKDGDKILIVNDAAKNTVSKYASGSRLAPASVTLSGDAVVAVSDDAAVFEVSFDGEDVYLHTPKGYLTSNDTGNGLYYSAEKKPCSVWRFTEGRFLYNPNSAYTSGGTVYNNDYLEYYPKSDYYSTYGKSGSSDVSYYAMSFYKLTGEAEQSAGAGGYSLPLFETSDLHGYLADTSSESYEYRLAYIADKVKDVRGYGDGYDVGAAILLDGGDIYQGNSISNLLGGKPLSAAFDLMDYDAVTIGNHEFDRGIEAAVDGDGTMTDYSLNGTDHVNDVPVVVSNIYKDGKKIDFAQDYVILEKTAVNNMGETLAVKVAVIGFATDYASSIMYANFTGAGYTVSVDYAALNRLATQLEDSGACDATVLLSHGEASEVAAGLGRSTVIDLVLGGHTHQNVCGLTSWGLRYIQPACYGAAYAYSELVFSREDGCAVFEKVAAAQTVYTTNDKSKLYDLEKNSTELDPELISLSNVFIGEISGALNEKIGYITVSASKYDYIPQSGERSTTMGNWLSSITARAAGADVGFMNSGGIREQFTLQSGGRRDITVADVCAMFPFENTIYCYEFTLEEFMTVLRYALNDSGKTLLSRMTGVDCYFTGGTVNAIVFKGETVYANGVWQKGARERKIKVAVSDYIATSDRASDGMSNPFCGALGEKCFLSAGMTDQEGALEVLKAEAAASDGLLYIDSETHFINKPFTGTVSELGGTEAPQSAAESGSPEESGTAKAAGTETAPADPGEKRTDKTVLIIVIIICAAVITAAAVVIVIVIKRRKSRKAS